LQGTWAVRFNRFQGENGRPFQGRYKAWHVEPGAVLAQVAHYIHLNPLAAGIVAADRLLSFRPSSLYWYPSHKRPAWLNPSTVLHASGELSDTAEGGDVIVNISPCSPRSILSSARNALQS